MKPVSELKMTNFAHLRLIAIEKLKQEPTRVVTMSEYQMIIEVVRGSGLDFQEETVIELLGHLQHDMTDQHALPKWAALASWLNPHGLLSRHPKLIDEISKVLLGT